MPEKKRRIKIATFNVNSIRARLEIIISWLEKNNPDVLCMQETKVHDDQFPRKEFEKIGYIVGYHGQKAYNGVAIASRETPKAAGAGLGDIKEPDQARLIWAKIAGINIVNTYVPQGREMDTEQYEYKLKWLQRCKKFLSANFTPHQKVLLCGDLNVALEDIDVYNHKIIKNHVCFNPGISKALYDVIDWGLVDVFRKHHPEPGQFTWFDYRLRGTVERNIGWRVDHVLATKSLANKSVDSYIDLIPRKMEKPSDHAPVVAEFEL